MIPKGLGRMLEALQDEKELTPDILARRARLAKPYIWHLERGARTNPSLPALRRLAKALGVPATKLLA
jgi:transcriptional regulator with XRE-family HTH domain